MCNPSTTTVADFIHDALAWLGFATVLTTTIIVLFSVRVWLNQRRERRMKVRRINNVTAWNRGDRRKLR